METTLDLYTDYLIANFGQSSATGLSALVDNAISHDSVTRLLQSSGYGSKLLWQKVKPLVKAHQTSSGCLVFDDTIIEKEYTDENELICWHFDHSKQRNVKGMNLLSALYVSQEAEDSLPLRVPVLYELITKPVSFSDVTTRKEKRKSMITKNELLRQMVAQAIHNQLLFSYVLADSWFASSENMRYIAEKKKYFIFDLKSNRNAALSEEARSHGHWTQIQALNIPNNTATKVWLKDLEFPVVLTKQVLTNKDGTEAVRFLVSNDFSLSDDDCTRLYKKRWSVEEYHKSLKQNVGVGTSPTRRVVTQSNHVFASIIAYCKLEELKFITKLNHFALKTKIYVEAAKIALNEVMKLNLKLAHA